MNIPSILFILMMFHREEALKTMSFLVYQVYRKNKRNKQICLRIFLGLSGELGLSGRHGRTVGWPRSCQAADTRGVQRDDRAAVRQLTHGGCSGMTAQLSGS